MSHSDPSPASRTIESVVEKYTDDLIGLRRDLHAHPELSWEETRTTEVVAARLREAGLTVTRLDRTGLYADLGSSGPVVALRADLDALPVEDTAGEEWASRTPGVAHACGHDVHTAGLVGAALALAEVHDRGQLPGRVRFFFQPAEEIMPGGALHMIESGALDDVSRIFMLHCDPTLDVGELGLRDGPLTGAADMLSVHLSGRGGHTSRPHLTEDLTFALGKVITELPAILSRRLDPRAGVSLVWGMVRAGSAPNVIPGTGQVAGTVRMLDAVAWAEAEALVRDVIDEIVSPYGVAAVVDYRRGVPPVVNDTASTRTPGPCHRACGRPVRTGRHQPEPGRRGLRLVPGQGARRHGEARDQDARRPDVRPPPGESARGRPGHRDRRAGARRRGARRLGHRLITTCGKFSRFLLPEAGEH